MRKEQQTLLYTMRTLRGQYMENVRSGKTPMDKEVLEMFDKELGYLHEAVLGKPKRPNHKV